MNQTIKIIDEMIQELHKNDGVYGTGYLDMTKINLLEEVKKRISSPPSDTQWIDVNIELPEERKEVLFSSKGTTKLGYYVKSAHGNTEYWYSGGGYYTGKITHWMPLPLPPNN